MTTYTDIDLSFLRHPGNHDVLKKFDVEAVKQALRNIFMTDKFEKPFDPDFGLGLSAMLFENYDFVFNVVMKRKITEQLIRYEPRCTIDDLDVQSDPDGNSVNIILYFHVIGNPSQQTLNVVIERVR